MKLLTVAIPCYNSAEYMNRAIDTVLTGGEEIEILIVNDGSKDDTAKIADEYAAANPTMIRVIHQENGGHGEAVNTGLRNATGLYYKVVDSDDWVEEEALQKVLALLRSMVRKETNLDLLIANYVYEKVSMNKQKVMDYLGAIPTDRIIGWDDIEHFRSSQYILMHSVIYRTQLLRDCGLVLPKHTFYVDNIFVYQPLPKVKTMYYINVDLYRYFIGREDQSVNEKVMISRIDQQIRVTQILIESHDLTKLESRKLRQYMRNYLAMMMTVCTVFLFREGSKESIQKKKGIWNFLKQTNYGLYKEVSSCLLGLCMQMKGIVGRRIIVVGYKITKKIFGFG